MAFKAEAVIESPDPRRSRSFSRLLLEPCSSSPSDTQRATGRIAGAEELRDAAVELTRGARQPSADTLQPTAFEASLASPRRGPCRRYVWKLLRQAESFTCQFQGPPPPAALEAFLASGTFLQNGGEGHAAMHIKSDLTIYIRS